MAEHTQDQAEYLECKLNPRLEGAKAFMRRVYFVDASHCVFGTFLCCMWSLARLWIPAASGRQRFNVRGAYDPIRHELISIKNTTTVNTETICELLQSINEPNLKDTSLPVTPVLDNARYQRHEWVQELANEMGIKLLFLPSYSPNLNLIGRYWMLVKKQDLYGRYYRDFKAF